MAGVAKTGRVPEPTAWAVFSSRTTSSARPLIPISMDMGDFSFVSSVPAPGALKRHCTQGSGLHTALYPKFREKSRPCLKIGKRPAG